MWNVRWWRAYKGTIGGIDAPVSSTAATLVGTRIREMALGRRGGFARE